MALADRANQYVDEHKPWELAKQPGREAELQAVCSEALNLFRLLTLYLKPVLPHVAQQVEALPRHRRRSLGPTPRRCCPRDTPSATTAIS